MRLLLPLLLLAPTTSAEVVNADHPGVAYSELQPAIDAAADGDVLLVSAGSYAGFVIDGKGLAILVHRGHVVQVNGTVEVTNLPRKHTVLVAELAVAGQEDVALRVADCVGAVRVQDVALTGGLSSRGSSSEFPPGRNAVEVTQCVDVSLIGCAIQGGAGAGSEDYAFFDWNGGDGGHGLVSTSSRINLYHCAVEGGQGGAGGVTGGDGGDACRVLGAPNTGIFAAGSSFAGADGGTSWDVLCLPPGDGGDGLFVDSLVRAELFDDVYTGGSSGTDCGGVRSGAGGSGVAGGPAITYHEGVSRRMVTDVVDSDIGMFCVTATGLPGDECRFPESIRTGSLFAPQYKGVWHVPYPAKMPVAPTLVIDPSGTTTVHVPFRPLAASEPHQLRFFQGYVVTAGGEHILASPMHVWLMNHDGGFDCNGNGQNDIIDVMIGLELDCDGDLVPDSCDPDCP